MTLLGQNMSEEQREWAGKQERGERERRSVWQVRTRSEQPFLMEDTRGFTAPYLNDPEEGLSIVMQEARVMIGRMSYMVNGPNREVMWSVEKWDKRVHIWVSVVQGKSRVKEGSKPL